MEYVLNGTYLLLTFHYEEELFFFLSFLNENPPLFVIYSYFGFH